MSLYGARHSSNLPAGFVPPPPQPVDPERTVYLPPEQVRAAISAQSVTYRPAWQVPSSGVSRPTAADVRRMAGVATSHRRAELRAYAASWLDFCLCGGEQAPAPPPSVSVSDARAVRRRLLDAGAFDPRDFHNVPF